MSKLPAPLDRLPFPVIGAPMFILSTPKLVIAQCIAGVVGSMPALNARPAELLDEWLHEITETLAAHNRAPVSYTHLAKGIACGALFFCHPISPPFTSSFPSFPPFLRPSRRYS